MIIDHPKKEHLPALKELWREAFGDEDEVIDAFFSYAYSPERCFTVISAGSVAAAAYYFRCTVDRRPIAYVYGVAVRKSCRGQGISKLLLEKIHRRLSSEGFSGAILVPADEGLFSMYERLGYSSPVYLSETFVTEAALDSILKEKITPEKYTRLRRAHIPRGGVIQEGESLTYLSETACLYRTSNGVACVFKEHGRPVSAEVLGEDVTKYASADGTVKVRHPGTGKKFALYKSFDASDAPSYLGIAFD